MNTVPIEISARHVHLTAEAWQRVFGTEGPTAKTYISQVPQFLAEERVTLQGPKGVLERIGVVGPLRTYNQVELAMTDCRQLGMTAPLRDSGNVTAAGEVTVVGPAGSIMIDGAIVQQRHIHCSPAEAAEHGVTDKQLVAVRVGGPRGGQFDNVLIRVHPDFSWRMHVDTDEANAFGIGPDTTGEIVS